MIYSKANHFVGKNSLTRFVSVKQNVVLQLKAILYHLVNSRFKIQRVKSSGKVLSLV